MKPQYKKATKHMLIFKHIPKPIHLKSLNPMDSWETKAHA